MKPLSVGQSPQRRSVAPTVATRPLAPTQSPAGLGVLHTGLTQLLLSLSLSFNLFHVRGELFFRPTPRRMARLTHLVGANGEAEIASLGELTCFPIFFNASDRPT